MSTDDYPPTILIDEEWQRRVFRDAPPEVDDDEWVDAVIVLTIWASVVAVVCAALWAVLR